MFNAVHIKIGNAQVLTLSFTYSLKWCWNASLCRTQVGMDCTIPPYKSITGWWGTIHANNITYLLVKQVLCNHYQYSMSDTAICLVTSLQILQWAAQKFFRCECDHVWLLMSCHWCWNPKWSHRLRTKSPFENEEINTLYCQKYWVTNSNERFDYFSNFHE